MNRRECLTLLAAAGIMACARGQASPAPGPDTVTTVRIDNRSYLDMTIYLIAGSQRIRLGQVTGNSTVVLRIPQQYVFGASQMRFIADPIGSNVAPISESITVIPGDEVILTIPPG